MADPKDAPQLVPIGERMEATTVDAPHPAALPVDQLLQSCQLRTQRRSGPGGQHRNKTSSGVFLVHSPTGIVGEATEKRSQAHNRAEAAERLRYRLAMQIRTASVFDASPTDSINEIESDVRLQHAGGTLKMNQANPAKPAVLALLLNDLHAAGGQPSLVAKTWKTTTSNLVAFLKSHPPAFTFVNQIRAHHSRRDLR